MEASSTDKSTVVESAIRNISHIATLPEVTLKVIDLVEDPSSTAQDLHKVIAHDPALCSRILKVVNSAFYGLPRQVGSINRAIVLLGLNAVKNIAIAASLTRLFRGGKLCPAFSAKDLWIHSIATAGASKVIGDMIKLGVADEAFLAGLIHDIGIMVEMQAMRKELTQVFSEIQFDETGAPLDDMREHERRILGADHCAFGAGLCELWKFPSSFVLVAGHHHEPFSIPREDRMLPGLIYVADRLVSELRIGFRADIADTTVDDSIYEELGITSSHLESIKEQLPDVFAQVQATFE